MRKVAIFVEGMTEQELVVSLVSELVGNKNVHFEYGRQWKGKVSITAKTQMACTRFYVLIIDCMGDEQVKTQIRDQYTTLVAAGYTSIIGLRDVFPLDRAKIPQIQKMLSNGLPSGAVTPNIHLAIMEVEAWFLGEITHFIRIDKTLTVAFIVSNGFDIETQSAESWCHPTAVLDSIYKLGATHYLDKNGKKKKRRVAKTIKALSFEELYVNLRFRLPGLNGFITSIENALF
jgi:hypothetical protein